MTVPPEHRDVASILEVIDSLQARLAVLRRDVFAQLSTHELPDGLLDLLTCRVGELLVALPLRSVEEVVRRCAFIPVPEAPPWVAGLVDLRGDPVPVLDLRARLFGRASPLALTDVLVICRAGQRRAAILVQQLGQVLHDRELELREEVHDVPHAAFVVGAARVDDQTLLVLGAEQLVQALALPEVENTA